MKRGVGQPGYNDWRIVTLVKKSKSSEVEEEELRRDVLTSVADLMAEQVVVGKYGAFTTTDEAADGYYVVEWISEPYLKEGVKVCDAIYYNMVLRAKGWYTRSTPGIKVVVRMQHAVAANLLLEPIDASNKLPNTCNKKHATQLGAKRVSDHDHEVIMEEARRRDLLEHDGLEQLEEDEEAESEDEAESEIDEASGSESGSE